MSEYFEFSHGISKVVFTVDIRGKLDADWVKVCWKDDGYGYAGDAAYHAATVKRNVADGVWTVTKDLTPNGFDADGKPKNFTVADLRNGMRAVINGGNRVFVKHEGRSGFYMWEDEVFLSTVNMDAGWSYCPTEVYEPPLEESQAFTFHAKGKLIWQRADPAKVAKRLQLQADIAAAQKELDELGD